MPKQHFYSKRRVSSLLSICVDHVAIKLHLYIDSTKFLPPEIRERLLRKLLSSYKLWTNLSLNKSLSVLVHRNLKQIDLSLVNVDDSTLHTLQSCSELNHICLENNNNQHFSSVGLVRLFQHLTKLLTIDVTRCQQFNDSVLESVNCQNLYKLVAEGSDISDKGLTLFAQFNKKIRCLTISDTNVTGDGIAEAVKNKRWIHLQELRLDNCSKVNDDVLKVVIQNCPKLEILTFYNCAVTNETNIFQEITTTCKKLKQLHWTVSW